MALSKIESNGQTNATWRGVIDAGIDVLNEEILQTGSTISVTQSGGESTTQCVVTGHVSQTLNASDYNNSATDTIEAALALLPKNMGGHTITLKFGLNDSNGQTVTISDSVNIYNYTGGVFFLLSAYSNDNESDSSTKANKIQSAGTSIERLFSVSRCTEVYVQGLEFIQNTSTQTNSFVLTLNTGWVDVNHVKLTGGGTGTGKYALLVQRGATVYFRDSWVDNAYAGILTQNNGKVSATNVQYTGTKPAYGVRASNGIAIINGSHIEGSTADYFVSSGGLITNKSGLILEETILRTSKTVDIPAGTTGDEIRALIADQPKFLNGHGITFRFAAAAAGSQNTYDLGNTTTYLTGFTGGNIIFQAYDFTADANVDETGTGSGTYRTKITGSKGGYDGIIHAGDNSADFFVNDLAFEITGTNNNTEIILSRNSTTYVDRCQFKGNEAATTNANPMGIRIARGFGEVTNSYFSDLDTAILADEAADVYAASNDDYGNAVLNGQTAQRGSKIGLSGTKVDGSVKDLATSTGGLIIPAGGVILSDQSGGGFGTSAEAVYGQTQL